MPLAGPRREGAGTCRGLHGGRVCSGPLPPPGPRRSAVRSVAAVASEAPTARRARCTLGGGRGRGRGEGGGEHGARSLHPAPTPRAHEREGDAQEPETQAEADGSHRWATERSRLSAAPLPALLVPELIGTRVRSSLRRKEKKGKKRKASSITKEASISGSKLQTIGVWEQCSNLTSI